MSIRQIASVLLVFIFSACSASTTEDIDDLTDTTLQEQFTPTPLPQRPVYEPGEIVEYVVRSGDTLPALAARFNTTIAEIRQSNPSIPQDATTLPPGMPLLIPIYYRTFWGSSFYILPDSLFVNGPSVIGFDVEAFVQSQPGWLKDFHTYAQGASRSGAEVVGLVSTNYSISPEVLLIVMEYLSGALSQPVAPISPYPLGIDNYHYPGLYMQLIWVANILNHGFYGWRTGKLYEFELLDGKIERPDPWQTAASVGFQYFASLMYEPDEYRKAIGADGFARVYQSLFGDPWLEDVANIPVSLEQPELTLPFNGENEWAFTGGPHTGWGTLYPWAALDFAPGAETGGCTPTTEPTVAMADGIVVRSETGVVILDLDGDGDERTGWNLLYLHVATGGRVPAGTHLTIGETVGYPSCEGGTATGTHVHIARKFNGEWIPADGAIPFILDGWTAHEGDDAYQGTLTKNGKTVIACTCSIASSQIYAGK